jgi:integrase
MTMTTYGKLTPGRIDKLRLPKGKANLRVSDGGGLYLQITKTAKGGETKAWLFRFTSPTTGKKRDMGLGELANVKFEEDEAKTRELFRKAINKAREDAYAARLEIRDGIDPIDARKAKKAERRATTAVLTTFREATAKYIRSRKREWTNPVHAEQWVTTLAALPEFFNKMPVNLIATSHVAKALEDMWNKTPETASRTRARIEKVLGWAKAHGLRDGENPARWKENLDASFTKVAKLKKPDAERRHAAMRYDDIPGFMGKLRAVESKQALFLEALILTAVRLGELRAACWREFDLKAGIWTIPAAKAKHRKAPHRVALCPRAVEILEGITSDKEPDALVFPGEYKATIAVSESAVARLLAQLADPLPDGRKVTLHGMRSSFSSWRAARTAFPADAAEAQLGHLLGRDDTERAYQREDLLEIRMRLMAAWEKFCSTPREEKGAVIPLRPAEVA